jgi:hypothetical protein
MHAVSLTPHAWYIWGHWHRMHDACGVNDTVCTVYAVSLTMHAKYDTACTIDERFEWPWHPLACESRAQRVLFDEKTRRPKIGLKRKWLFIFSQKCKNHAKMGQFSRNFAKFRLAKIFRFQENFRENFRFSENPWHLRENGNFRKHFCEHQKFRENQNSCENYTFLAQTKYSGYFKKVSTNYLLHKTLFREMNEEHFVTKLIDFTGKKITFLQ